MPNSVLRSNGISNAPGGMNWKLHNARHNTAACTPAPLEGQHSFLLPRPEMLRRIEDLLRGFRAEVQQAYAE